MREVGDPSPVDAETVFQLASVSKPIGSTVVAALVGEGLLSWDSRISDLDPGFEMHHAWVTREITIGISTATAVGCPSTQAICWKILALPARKFFTVCGIKNRIAASGLVTLIQTSG